MKYFLTLWIFLIPLNCSNPENKKIKNTLYVLTDTSPKSINPRQSFERLAENIQQLTLTSLTKIDENSHPTPGMATQWTSNKNYTKWIFNIDKKIIPDSKNKNELTLKNIYLCLENYRVGKTPSLTKNALLPEWKKTTFNLKKHEIQIELTKPNSNLPFITSSFFYFLGQNSEQPCLDPEPNEPILGFGDYAEKNDKIFFDFPKEELFLTHKKNLKPSLNFKFIKDENSRLLSFIKGDGDVILNGLNLSNTGFLLKKNWVGHKKSNGLSLDYIGFNLKHPILSNLNIRKAISHSIDRESIVKYKYKNLVDISFQFLPKHLFSEGEKKIIYSPELAIQLLDKSGFKKNKNGYYFELNFLSTPQSIGIERALIIRDQLKKVGIKINILVVEPAIFFQNLKNGNFDLFASRFLRVHNSSFYEKIFSPQASQNYFSYENKRLNFFFHNKGLTPSHFSEIETILFEDLPLLPLWYWSNVLLYNKKRIDSSELKYFYNTGSFLTLTELKELNI